MSAVVCRQSLEVLFTERGLRVTGPGFSIASHLALDKSSLLLWIIRVGKLLSAL